MQPTLEDVKNYTNSLETLLIGQNWTIELTLSNEPHLTSFFSEDETPQESWFDDVMITSLNGEKIIMNAYSSGLMVLDMHPNALFRDAYELQNAFYREKDLQIPVNTAYDKPYWKLWNSLEE